MAWVLPAFLPDMGREGASCDVGQSAGNTSQAAILLLSNQSPVMEQGWLA